MRVLFVGGTGNISLSCTREALSKGWEVFHLNRGTRSGLTPDGVTTLTADVRKPGEIAKALGDRTFDAVVDWIAFVPEHIRADIEAFSGRTRQFVFISSASAYEKPVPHYIITESTPLFNPFWQYSRDKIACERMLREAFEKDGFPATIVRPSHTYSDGWLPTTFGSADFTVPQRMLEGKEVIVHGDGTSLWTLTHADDFAKGFVGLLGNPQTLGESFHITGDEVLTWEQIHRTIAYALGVEPKIVHIPSDFIAELYPEIGAGLLGDKAYSAVFDNTKIKRFVPGFQARIPFHQGVMRSLEWFKAHPEKKTTSPKTNQVIDHLVSLWREKLS